MPVSVLGEMEAIRAKSEFTGGSLGGTQGISGFLMLSKRAPRRRESGGSLDKKGSGGPQVGLTKATWPDDQ